MVDGMSQSSGDADWETVYDQAYPRLFRALTAVLLDREAARDALQDAFLEGVRRPPPNHSNLAGWLYRVALRKARIDRRWGHGALDLNALLGRRDAPRADDLAGASLDRLEVIGLLRLLTARQRSIVVAFYYVGLDQTQIADLLGVRRGTIASTLSQALTRMRREAAHAR